MTLVDSYFLGAYAGHGWEFESLWIRFILSCIHDTPSRREQDSSGEGLCWQCTYLGRRYRAPERGTEAESDWGEKGTLAQFAFAIVNSYQHMTLVSVTSPCHSFHLPWSAFYKCYGFLGLRLPHCDRNRRRPAPYSRVNQHGHVRDPANDYACKPWRVAMALAWGLT
jgi:hypothetical protein